MPVRVILICLALFAITVCASAQEPPTKKVVEKDVVVISENADPAAVLIGEDAAGYYVSEDGAKIYAELLKAIEQLVESGELSEDGAARLSQLLSDLKDCTTVPYKWKQYDDAVFFDGQTPDAVESEVTIEVEDDGVAKIYQMLSGDIEAYDPFANIDMDCTAYVIAEDFDGPITAEGIEVTIDEDSNYTYTIENPEAVDEAEIKLTIVTEEDGEVKTFTVTPEMEAEADFMTVVVSEDGDTKFIEMAGNPEVTAMSLSVEIGEDGVVHIDGEGIDEAELKEIQEQIERQMENVELSFDDSSLESLKGFSMRQFGEFGDWQEFKNGDAHLFMFKPHLEALKELEGLSEEDLEALDLPEQLLKLYELKELEGLEEIENLDDLKFIYKLPELEALEALGELPELQELEELEQLFELPELQELEELEQLQELPELQELEGLEQLYELKELSELDGLHEEIERVLEEVESLLEKLAELKELKEA